MRKIIFLSTVLLFFHLYASAQHKISIYKSCGFSREDTTSDGYAWDANDQALEYVKRICDISGISKNFTVQRSSVTEIACAVIDANNNRIIYYNQDFFGSLNNETYKIAILAHEIAHHLNNNLLTKDSKRTSDELDADKFAGSVICKLGLKLDDAKKLYITECPSYSKGVYPARNDRIQAFAVGFYDAGCQNGNIPKQPVLTQQPNNIQNRQQNENPVATTGSIKVSNNINTTLVLLLGTETVEPANFGNKYFELTIGSNSSDNFDGVAPGVYYLCAAFSRADFRGCVFSKRIVVEAGKVLTVNINAVRRF